MDSTKFLKLAKKEVLDYLNDERLSEEDIFVVWSCKTLQNNKALLSAVGKGVPYFEITFNGDKNELYVDVYKKVCNKILDYLGG